MPNDFVDPSVLKKLEEDLGNDVGQVQDLIRAYLSEAPGFIQRLREGVERGSPPQVEQAAHSLKSTSATFGASQLASFAKELELMGRSGSLAGAREKLRAIQDLYPRVEQTLRRWPSGR